MVWDGKRYVFTSDRGFLFVPKYPANYFSASLVTCILGIDFLITPDLKPYVVEVNVGLPGGAQEYHLTHLVHFNSPSDVFDRIENTSQRVYGKPFKEYLHSLPFIENLKSFKIWMDGMGPFPDTLHPGLRLEDKWVQYQLISPLARMPETMIFDPLDLAGLQDFWNGKEGLS